MTDNFTLFAGVLIMTDVVICSKNMLPYCMTLSYADSEAWMSRSQDMEECCHMLTVKLECLVLVLLFFLIRNLYPFSDSVRAGNSSSGSHTFQGTV